MEKRLILPGGILWILGIILSITGLNIPNDTGSMLSIIGNILFLLGLGILGAAWLIRQRNANRENSENPDGGSGPDSQGE